MQAGQSLEISSDSGENLAQDEEHAAACLAGKRPYNPFLPCTPENDGPQVDIAAFFDELGVETDKRVSLCRAYANYLAQVKRARK